MPVISSLKAISCTLDFLLSIFPFIFFLMNLNLLKVTSTITTSELRRYIRDYRLEEEDIGCKIPPPLFPVFTPPKGKTVFNLRYLYHGLRLPVTPFFAKVLKFYGFHLGQLCPNAVLKIITLELACHAYSIPLSLYVFAISTASLILMVFTQFLIGMCICF